MQRGGSGRGLSRLGRILPALGVAMVIGGVAMFAVYAGHAAASSDPAAAPPPGEGVVLGKSGLPVPRFVSLKAGRVNVRVGPGEDYRLAWVFTRSQLPVEVIAEFDTWRRIRDSDGQVGWVFHSLLSGKRTAVVTPWAAGDPHPIRAAPGADARVTAYLQPGVLATIERCDNGWCDLSGKGFSGWIGQDQLWGVYPDESVD